MSSLKNEKKTCFRLYLDHYDCAIFIIFNVKTYLPTYLNFLMYFKNKRIRCRFRLNFHTPKIGFRQIGSFVSSSLFFSAAFLNWRLVLRRWMDSLMRHGHSAPYVRLIAYLWSSEISLDLCQPVFMAFIRNRFFAILCFKDRVGKIIKGHIRQIIALLTFK